MAKAIREVYGEALVNTARITPTLWFWTLT